MTSRVAAAGAAVITGISASTIAVLPAAASHASGQVEPVRMLIVGDSVTHGRDGDRTWRYVAWKELTADGVASRVDFVGPQTGSLGDGGDTFGGGYADPRFDQDHASRWGLSYWEMLDHAWWPEAQRIDVLVGEERPDVVVTALGVNDLMFYGFDAESLSDQVRAFVTEARTADPDVDVVVGGIPQTWIGEAAAFNAGLPALAVELSTPTSHVVAAPVPVWERGVDTYDNAHPTRSGEAKLGTAFASVLEPLLPAVAEAQPPSDPPAATPVVAQPSPAATPPPVATQPAPAVRAPGVPRGVRARRQGRKVVVSWRAAERATSYAVRCRSTTRRSSGLRISVRTRATSCRVQAVSLVGVSPWVAVRVRN